MSIELMAAQARATAARARLNDTVETRQTQLAPDRLARIAVAEVTDSGTRAALASVEVAKRNPAGVAGAALAVVMFLGRRRIAAGARRIRCRDDTQAEIKQPALEGRVSVPLPAPAERT